MISLKLLSTAAVMALVLPIVASTASSAQTPERGRGAFAAPGGGGAPAARVGGGGGAFRAATPQVSGGGAGFRAATPQVGGGAGFRAATPQVSSGAPVTRFSGGGGAGVTRYSGGGGWQGGYRYRRGGGGFIPGAVAGAVVGGAIASQSYGYYGGSGYYAPGYYDDQYYDDSVVAVAPAPVGDDAVAYCMQTYQSYDPASGTYLGYDGLRHPCP